MVRKGAVLFVITCLAASPSEAQRTRRDSSSAERVQPMVAALAHDSLAGRLTGTPGGASAARFIAAELERAGVRPGGDSGFFQAVPLGWHATQIGNGQTRREVYLYPSFRAREAAIPAADRVHAVNVVGVLAGADPLLRDEAVIVSAHYDHIGTSATNPAACRAREADSLCNGADDDASGVVAVLEVARMLAAAREAPKRTIIFLLVTGEEFGMLGSRWYADNPAHPIERTVANLQVEMIGRPDSLAGGTGRAWLTGFERSSMGPMLAGEGVPIVADPRPEMRFFELSDNIVFAYRGVPAHTVSSYNLHSDYHRPTDEVAGIDASHMAAVVNAIARAARLLADGPAPEWNPGGRPVQPRR